MLELTQRRVPALGLSNGEQNDAPTLTRPLHGASIRTEARYVPVIPLIGRKVAAGSVPLADLTSNLHRSAAHKAFYIRNDRAYWILARVQNVTIGSAYLWFNLMN